ncbi:MAG: transposase [Oligoflexus sp.]
MQKKRPRRSFTPQQKADIVHSVQSASSIQQGLDQFGITSSLYYRWPRQLEVGINASLRNSKPLKSVDLKRLEAENRQLKEVVLNQSLELTSLKKSLSLDP